MITQDMLGFVCCNSLSTLKTFLNYAETHFQKKIKTLRKDNAFEFDNGPCQAYFAENGIVHQTSYVKRPQQNARVIDMFQVGLGLQFWGRLCNDLGPHN